ncbi:hypothetical protein [Methanobacterium oryzae]|uniref:hypothetical protein n=1 Tax=Methanobacterium oryzae TaxID=69540 RepID=UPI003D1E66BF
MVDVKEIKEIKIVPFTLMSSSISAILAFIGGILLAIFLGIAVAFLPSPWGGLLAGFGVAAIIAYPILTFLVGLSTVFLSVLLYNLLVPRVGGVKLAMDGNNVAEIPIVPFALILSIIGAIWALIIGLVLATAIAPITGLIGTSIPLIANATNTSFTGAAFGAGTAVLYVFLIIGLPIIVLIGGLIWNALFAIFYNYIAVRVAKIQLNFTAVTGAWNDLTSVPIIPAALALAIISAVFGLIQGILNIGAYGDIATGIGALIGNIIGSFIWTFIVTAIAVFLYNFLAPKIGAVRLTLE